jgi:predicted dehydrogenase
MLKAGFIGFGRMGITHFSILNSHPKVDIRAVCDSSRTMMNILSKYSEVNTYTDYKHMLDKEFLDFVVISTPTDSHAQIIKSAIGRDLHIFCEKPFVLSKLEGQEILNLLAGKSIVNQIGYVNRFNEVFKQVKQLISNGMIGEIKSFNSEMYGPTVLKDNSGNWRGKKNLGGGCMLEFASHCIDLAVYLMGQPDHVIGGVLQSIYSANVEDLVRATLIYDKGYTGTISGNWSDASFRKPTNIFTVWGTKGKIIADKHAYKIFLIKQPQEKNGFHQGWNTRYITDLAQNIRFYVRGNEFTQQLDYFVDCILAHQPASMCDFNEAFKTDVVMNEIIHNFGQGDNIDQKEDRSVFILKKPSRRYLFQKLRTLLR